MDKLSFSSTNKLGSKRRKQREREKGGKTMCSSRRIVGGGGGSPKLGISMGERAGLAVAFAPQEEMAELGLEQGHLWASVCE
jgi:hypothetical protein